MTTREQILLKNYEAMCLHGYQGLRTDKVIQELGITKGAFYHYFSGKKELGYSIVDEIIKPHYLNNFLKLKEVNKKVIGAIKNIINSLKACSTAETIHIGCPLNNLIQEMSPLDETFRKKLNSVLQIQRTMLSSAIEKGKNLGEIKEEVSPDAVAVYVLAAIEGSYTLGKSFQSKVVFDQALDELARYLDTLAAKP